MILQAKGYPKMLHTFPANLQFFPAKKSKSANLCYRGCEYQPKKQSIETIESELVAKYRGARYSLKSIKEIPVHQVPCILTYRGKKYIKA